MERFLHRVHVKTFSKYCLLRYIPLIKIPMASSIFPRQHSTFPHYPKWFLMFPHYIVTLVWTCKASHTSANVWGTRRWRQKGTSGWKKLNNNPSRLIPFSSPICCSLTPSPPLQPQLKWKFTLDGTETEVEGGGGRNVCWLVQQLSTPLIKAQWCFLALERPLDAKKKVEPFSITGGALEEGRRRCSFLPNKY